MNLQEQLIVKTTNAICDDVENALDRERAFFKEYAWLADRSWELIKREMMFRADSGGSSLAVNIEYPDKIVKKAKDSLLFAGTNDHQRFVAKLSIRNFPVSFFSKKLAFSDDELAQHLCLYLKGKAESEGINATYNDGRGLGHRVEFHWKETLKPAYEETTDDMFAQAGYNPAGYSSGLEVTF